MFFLFNSNAACDSQKLTMTVSHVPRGMNNCVYEGWWGSTVYGGILWVECVDERIKA